MTGFLILKMGQINMNDLQADTSDIIKEILMCVVIAMTGMFGITGAMFTGNALYADSAGVYIYEAVITCVVVICISLPKIRKKFSIVYGLAVLLLFVAAHSMIISGFVHIANQLETFFRSGKSYVDIQGAVSSSDSKAYIAAQGQESLAIFLCVLIMAYIISFTVVYVRSMLVAIVEILPVMSLFIAYSVIPSAFVCVICITYVFCVAALERKKRDIKKPAVIFMICALVGTVLIVTDVVNKDYKRPQIFIEWGKDMDESVNGIFDGIVAGNADGGKNENNDDSGVKVTGLTNDGVIGEADSVQIKSDTVARITTLNTGKDLYIPTYTSYNYYYGGNRGHSDAIRRIAGVKDARQYTVPVPEAVEAVRAGKNPELTTRQKHTRECYVVAEEGADLARIENEIKTMPNYFSDYDTTVTFIDEETMKRDHNKLPHGGSVIRTGVTGMDREHKHVVEYSLKLDSNPEFTGAVIAAYARAAYRMNKEGMTGCKTVFDIAPAYLSAQSGEELRAHLL